MKTENILYKALEYIPGVGTLYLAARTMIFWEN